MRKSRAHGDTTGAAATQHSITVRPTLRVHRAAELTVVIVVIILLLIWVGFIGVRRLDLDRRSRRAIPL